MVSMSELSISETIVFTYDETVCGFIFLFKEDALATVKEFYLEPGYKDKVSNTELSSRIKDILNAKDIEFIDLQMFQENINK